MSQDFNRRHFLKASLATASAASLSRLSERPASAQASAQAEAVEMASKLAPKAEAMVVIYLPGGAAQTDLWDPKRHTPYAAGMKGSDLLGTCPLIPTKADGISFGEGLEHMAQVMDKGTLLRTLSSDTKFGAVHLKAQYYLMTGYLFPPGVKAPSIGSVVSRARGRRDPNIPPYIYIGRDIDTSDAERLFINEYLGPGFYGVNHAPFMIPDPARGMETLSAAAGIEKARLDERLKYLKELSALGDPALRDSAKAQDYMKVMDNARAMMDSPVKKAFNFLQDEKPEVIEAYRPQITREQVAAQKMFAQESQGGYYNGDRFGQGLLLARRMLESGARFIQVEYEYGPFQGFDMHNFGRDRMAAMKKQIDRPLATFIRELDERGLLDKTLVVVMTEFGRTIADNPSAGREPDGATEASTGEKLVIESEQMFGFHGHFSSCNCVLFFGGGFKRGFAYGKTAQRHPMLPVENPVQLTDVHATIYKAMGIQADHSYTTEGRPFYVTNNGKGEPIDALLS